MTTYLTIDFYNELRPLIKKYIEDNNLRKEENPFTNIDINSFEQVKRKEIILNDDEVSFLNAVLISEVNRINQQYDTLRKRIEKIDNRKKTMTKMADDVLHLRLNDIWDDSLR